MTKKISLFVFLIFQLSILSGCVSNSFENISVSSETSTQNEQSKKDTDEFVNEAHNHGYPLILIEKSVDLNGDGQHDIVRLLAEWFPIFNERNEPSYNTAGIHYPLIEFEIDGQKYTHLWDEASYDSRLFLLSDNRGSGI